MKWSVVKLGSICDVKGGKRLPNGADFSDFGYPYIRARDIRDGKVTFQEPVYIDQSIRDKIKNYTVNRNEICITIVGINVGDVGIVPAFLDGANLTENAAKLINFKECDENYLNHYLQSSGIKEQMQLFSSGSAQDKLGLYKIKLLDVIFPPIKTQRKIAGILSAYDDLIENNKRRIALLEKMAEELYREWFVRFRFPGWREAEFEKGIPKGWEIRVLSDLADINKSNLKQNAAQGFIEYIDIGSVTTNHIDEATIYTIADAPGRARRKVNHGDIIWSSVRPANRAYALIFNPPKNLIVSTGFAVISPKDHYYYPFLLKASTTNSYVDQITAVAKGAAYPATSFEDFEKSKILTPEYQLIKQYYELINPIFEQIHLLGKKNKNLQETKNALLPRLISGKLAVEDLAVQLPPSMLESAV